jgi:two-component system, LytTR family, response regulator
LLKKHCPQVELLADFGDTHAALKFIDEQKPQLVFLDIEMPGMNGFELLEACDERNFEVVFTTAYNEYAIKAIRHSALDYLLKPVNKNELVEAVERVGEGKTTGSSSRVNMLLDLLGNKKSRGKIALPTMEGLIVIDPVDILYCESESAYTRFFMTDKRCITVSKVLKDAEALLTDKGFFRVHASYLINMSYVERYIRGDRGEVIMSNGKNIPVSRTKRRDFLNQLERL